MVGGEGKTLGSQCVVSSAQYSDKAGMIVFEYLAGITKADFEEGAERENATSLFNA
jgi:hypothetical protein